MARKFLFRVENTHIHFSISFGVECNKKKTSAQPEARRKGCRAHLKKSTWF